MADAFELKGVGVTASRVSRELPQRLRDDQVLARLGKRPVLKRNFGFMSMLGFGSTVMVTWESVLVLLSINLTNGGYAGSVYGFLFVWLGTATAFATMAELASMAPTAAGQYHWVAILAPKRAQVFGSYIMGWLTMIGWQAIVASGAVFCAELIQGLVVLNSPDYAPQPWQTMLLFWACIAVSVLFNTFIARILPEVEGFILVLHIFGFVAILVPLLYFAPLGDATQVFTSFYNGGGWLTQGTSFMVGAVGPAYALLGPDGIVHMSEEVENAAKNVPRAVVFSIMLNGMLGFAMLLAVLFSLNDLSTVLDTPTSFPIIAIFQDAVGSNAGATAMVALILTLDIAATISSVATASRMTWSFARDRGMPGWRLLKQVEPRATLPLWSIGLTCLISVLLSLIVLGSSAVFSDVVSLSIGSLYASYLIGNSLLLWKRITKQIQPHDSSKTTLINTPQSAHLAWGPWKIREPFGTIVNAFGCIYLAVMLVFSFWPVTSEVTPSTMNYSSLMVGAVVILSVVYFILVAKNTFTGPIVEVDLVDTGAQIKV